MCKFCEPTFKIEYKYSQAKIEYPKGRRKGQPRTKSVRVEIRKPIYESLGKSHNVTIENGMLEISSNAYCPRGDTIKANFCLVCGESLANRERIPPYSEKIVE